jgi:predicted CxxxxCH...CXXCH cytochrome family protein
MKRKSVMIAVLLASVSVGSLAFAQVQSGDSGAAAEAAPAAVTTIQPIAFPHDIHAGTYKMECMYCHFSAERSVDAGLPPVATCAGCHRLIPGTAHPEEVQKLIGYATRGEAIPWVRVYKVSDHVHFPHMRHVNAGLACQQCHGPVETMGAIEERDPAWPGNNMGKCVACHVEMGARRDCAVCHY